MDNCLDNNMALLTTCAGDQSLDTINSYYPQPYHYDDDHHHHIINKYSHSNNNASISGYADDYDYYRKSTAVINSTATNIPGNYNNGTEGAGPVVSPLSVLDHNLLYTGTVGDPLNLQYYVTDHSYGNQDEELINAQRANYTGTQCSSNDEDQTMMTMMTMTMMAKTTMTTTTTTTTEAAAMMMTSRRICTGEAVKLEEEAGGVGGVGGGGEMEKSRKRRSWTEYYDKQQQQQQQRSSSSPEIGGSGSGRRREAGEESRKKKKSSNCSRNSGRNSGNSSRNEAFARAALRPVDWGAVLAATARSRPTRRNVRISEDPQSISARRRRERISDRIRVLQRLVPNAVKLDTASMLEEAIHYLKFLSSQVQALHSLEQQQQQQHHHLQHQRFFHALG